MEQGNNLGAIIQQSQVKSERLHQQQTQSIFTTLAVFAGLNLTAALKWTEKSTLEFIWLLMKLVEPRAEAFNYSRNSITKKLR